MEQLGNNRVCKYCLGCNKMEDDEFIPKLSCEDMVSGIKDWEMLFRRIVDKNKCEVRGLAADEPYEWVYGYLEKNSHILQLRETAESKCCGVGTFKVKPESIEKFNGVYNENLNKYVKVKKE